MTIYIHTHTYTRTYTHRERERERERGREGERDFTMVYTPKKKESVLLQRTTWLALAK